MAGSAGQKNPFAKEAATTDSDLFTDASAPEVLEELGEATDDEALFAPPAEKPDDGDDKPKHVDIARFHKVLGERNDARRQAATVSEKLAAAAAARDALKDTAEGAKQMAAIYGERYAKREDGPGLLDFDSRFMEAFEEMTHTNQQAAQVAKQVKQILRETTKVTTPASGDTKTTLFDAEKPAPADKATATADPRVDALVAQAAIGTITGALAEVKPAFQNVVVDHIRAEHGDKLASLSASAVRTIAREFFKDKGFSSEMVLVPASDDSPGKTKRSAPARTRAGADTSTRSKEPGGGKDEPEKAKNLDDWRDARRGRVDALVRDFGDE